MIFSCPSFLLGKKRHVKDVYVQVLFEPGDKISDRNTSTVEHEKE